MSEPISIHAACASPIVRRALTIHPMIRPLILGAFRAYTDSFNRARGCTDLRELAQPQVRLPEGVNLTEALCARHAQSVYETVVTLALDGNDMQLDATSADGIGSLFGARIRAFVVGAVESRGAPTRLTIAAAAANMRDSAAFADSLLSPITGA